MELEIIESISHETVRQTLKKQNDEAKGPMPGDPAGSGRGVVANVVVPNINSWSTLVFWKMQTRL